MSYFVISHTGNVKREWQETGTMPDGTPKGHMVAVEDTRTFFVEEVELVSKDYGIITLSNGREISAEALRFESGIWETKEDVESALKYGYDTTPFGANGLAEFGAE